MWNLKALMLHATDKRCKESKVEHVKEMLEAKSDEMNMDSDSNVGYMWTGHLMKLFEW